jgi:hypothetical protein
MKQDDAHKIAIDYSWNWLQFHGSQRMTTFNLYLIIVAASFAGFVTAVDKSPFAISSSIGLIVVLAHSRIIDFIPSASAI